MAYTRAKRNYRSKPAKKGYANRRNYRRKAAVPRSRALARDVHYFKRTFPIGPWKSTGNASDPFSVIAVLSTLPGYSDFTTLFDRYMITGYKITMYPRNVTAGCAKPIVHLVKDYGDNSNITIDAAMQYGNYRAYMLDRPISFYCRPKAAQQVFNTMTVTGYGPNMKGQWIDMASPSIPHYGFKGVVEWGSTVSTGADVAVMCTVYFTCAGAR